MLTEGGLVVGSELTLPAHPDESGTARVDISIRLGAVPETLPGVRSIAPGWSVGPDRILLAVAGVGRFLVRSGADIVVQADKGAKESTLQLFLLGSAFGAAVHQRGLLPLHANAVATQDGCIAFAGASGAGKTTLAAYLATRGYPVLADDVCVLSVGADGLALAHPGCPQFKLWADAARMLGWSVSGRQRVDAGRDKYYFGPHCDVRFCTDPMPLRRLYLLEAAASGAGGGIAGISRAESLAELARHTYRPFLLKPLGLSAAHFDLCSRLVRSIEVYRLPRAAALSDLGVWHGDLEAHFNGQKIDWP
jgi:hypothetical protein